MYYVLLLVAICHDVTVSLVLSPLGHQVLDRCLELEAEVSQIPQLKRQVQGYRRSHTDMETADREKVCGFVGKYSTEFKVQRRSTF